MNQPGRNDPCPCGSGRKYKHCCLTSGTAGSAPTPASELSAELERAMSENRFESLEELQAFANEFMRRRNQQPLDEFHGLSPDQMHRMLLFPYESQELLAFAEPLDVTPEAPIAKLLDLLVEAIGDGRLKATATGNLPRKFCRDAALAYWGEEGYRERTEFAAINTEPDFRELHVVRVVAGLAGLVRKYKGSFVLSRDARRLLEGPGARALYPRLLRAYTTQFNWGYTDGYPELLILQQSFAFTLYLLRRYGDVERDQSFYEDAVIRAFPMALREVAPRSYSSPEETMRRCYTVRVMERFAHFFGLITLRATRDDVVQHDYRIRRAPLLDAAVEFRLPITAASAATRPA